MILLETSLVSAIRMYFDDMDNQMQQNKGMSAGSHFFKQNNNQIATDALHFRMRNPNSGYQQQHVQLRNTKKVIN